MRRLIFAASAVVVLMILAIAVVVINADDTATASQTDTTQPQTDTTQPQTDVPLPEFMEEHLQDLVERGFITEEQLKDMEGWFRWRGPRNGELPEDFDPEQFRERFRDHAPWHRDLPDDFDPEHFEGHRFGPHRFGFFGGDEDLADLFGLPPDELSDALADGTPPMDLVDDPEALIDSMVDNMEEALDQAVEDGLLTPAEANELIAEARRHAEALINGEGFKNGPFMGPMGPRGLGGLFGFDEFGPHPGFASDADPAVASA
jgi:hypothetical protein